MPCLNETKPLPPKVPLPVVYSKSPSSLRGLLRMLWRKQSRMLANAELAIRIAKEAVAELNVRAPFAGTVTRLDAHVGDTVLARADTARDDQSLLTITDMSSLVIDADVAEVNASLLRPGLRGEAALDGFADRPFAVQVLRLAPTASADKGTIALRLSITDPPTRDSPPHGGARAHRPHHRHPWSHHTMTPTSSADPFIALDGVRKSYAIDAKEMPIFTDLQLAIPRGDFVAIMGPSGSGKSTLLNMLAGIDRPDAGTLRIGPHRLDQMGEAARAAWRAHHMGIVFQFYNLLPTLNAAENVELPLLLKPLSTMERRTRVKKVLDLVGLAGREKQYPSQMSGGQQQRVGIARAIVLRSWLAAVRRAHR